MEKSNKKWGRSARLCCLAFRSFPLIFLLLAICFSGCGRKEERSLARGHITLVKDAERLKAIGATIIRGLYKPDSVVLKLYNSYFDSHIALTVPFPFQRSSIKFSRRIDGEIVGIDRKLTDTLARVCDVIFTQDTVAVYSYWGRSDSAGPYHEGDVLVVHWYKGGKEIDWDEFLLENVFKSTIQYTEDSRAIAYSRPFRFLIQSLYYAQAIASGKKEEYEEHLEDLQNYPALEILVPLK